MCEIIKKEKFEYIDKINAPNEDFKKITLILELGQYRNGKPVATVSAKIHDRILNFNFKNNQRTLDISIFNLILNTINAPLKDSEGNKIKKWKYDANCRFVSGRYRTKEGRFLKLEAWFAPNVYLYQAFNDADKQSIKTLIENNDFDYKIIQRS